MQTKMTKVLPHELVALTAESSGYYKYEVEDILLHFLTHLRNKIIDGHEVKLDNVCWLYAKKYATGGKKLKISDTESKDSYRLVVSSEASMKRDLNKKVEDNDV